MFTTNSFETHHMLRIQSNVRPKSLLKILNPESGRSFKSNIQRLSTIEPLTPMENFADKPILEKIWKSLLTPIFL